VIGSHDKPRIASHVGSDRARIAAMLLLTLPGTPVLYAGDEIGMQNGTIPCERAKDPFARRVPGYGLSRDPYRVPMRWEAGRAAGFTSGEPWLPIDGDDIERCNVAVQRQEERSLLALYRRLIAFRRSEPALLAGRYEALSSYGDVLAYWRHLNGRNLLVALNVGEAAHDVVWASGREGRIRLSTHLDRVDEPVKRAVRLRLHEGIIVEVGRQ
jgi:alpha-glucosidase